MVLRAANTNVFTTIGKHFEHQEKRDINNIYYYYYYFVREAVTVISAENTLNSRKINSKLFARIDNNGTFLFLR